MTTRPSAHAPGQGVTTDAMHALLAQLRGIRDPEGVLSVYASSDAAAGVRHGPHAGDIAVRSALDALQDDVTAGGPRSRAVALRTALDRLRSALEELTDPTRTGRGRALFAPLGGGDHRVVTTRTPLEPLAVLRPAPYLRPLLGPLDAGRPAGAVAVSAGAVRAVCMRDGSADEVLHLQFDDQSGDWRRLKGPASGNPFQAAHMASQRDLYQRRLHEHRERFVGGAAAALVATAAERGWERLCIAGDPEFAEALAAAAGDHIETVRDTSVPRHDLSPAELARALTPCLDAAREARHAQLVKDVRDAALAARGTAVLGMDDVLTALAEGRVHRLLLDVRHEVAGSISPDGRLVRTGQRPAGVDPDALVGEPHLVERIIEQTLAAGGHIVPLVPSAADGLAEEDGVAAFLRW